MDARSDLVTGELVERKEDLFSLCRRLCRAGGGSMIMTSTVDAVDIPEDRRLPSGSGRSAPPPGGHPTCSRNCSIDRLVTGPSELLARSVALGAVW